jgi:hypothetical protein
MSQCPRPAVVDLTNDDDDIEDQIPTAVVERKRGRSPQEEAPRRSLTTRREPSVSVAASRNDAIVIDDSSDDDDNDGGLSAVAAQQKGPEPWELVLAHVDGVSVFDKLALRGGAVVDAASPTSGDEHVDRSVDCQTDGAALLRSTAFARSSAAIASRQIPTPFSSTTPFVPSTTGSSSPFFRAPSQAVQLRQKRIAVAGLHILRLPSADVITDNGSVFDAFVVKHAGLTTDNIHDCLAEIRSDAKISLAAHPGIFAYRLRNGQTQGGGGGQPLIEYSDDNGEEYAGKKILDVLRTYRCEDCLVVVVRWFGGKLLGPRRFTHISNVSKRVLERHGVIASPLATANQQ